MLSHNEQVELENVSLRKQAAELNEECQEYKSQLNALQIVYDRLCKSQTLQLDNYRFWNADTITDWIVSLNKDYEMYEDVLRSKLNEESLDGACLAELDKNDLDRFGIKGYKHKSDVLKAIKQLTSNNI